MSVTVTENRTAYSLARTLADYNVQHSDEPENTVQEPNARPAPEGTGNAPSDWEDNFRRVPAYRPIDTELDFASRNVYNNNIERAFVWNLFTGVRIVAVCSSLHDRAESRVSDMFV